jgi:hypothetical protein
MSAGWASATLTNSSSVAELNTSNLVAPEGRAHLPPMKN